MQTQFNNFVYIVSTVNRIFGCMYSDQIFIMFTVRPTLSVYLMEKPEFPFIYTVALINKFNVKSNLFKKKKHIYTQRTGGRGFSQMGMDAIIN